VSASSVTKIGRFLRATKLDEIPQLWNVVRGEMAFVGPRPCLPSQTELVQEREIRGVYGIIPGITGLGQVRGIDMSEPLRLAEIDAEYLQTRSLALDLRLAWQTVRGGGSGDRVKST
jgi:O-antigen biosynthesis protein WbqP